VDGNKSDLQGRIAILFQFVMRIQIKKFASKLPRLLHVCMFLKERHTAIFASLHNSSERLYNFPLALFYYAARFFFFANREKKHFHLIP